MNESYSRGLLTKALILGVLLLPACDQSSPAPTPAAPPPASGGVSGGPAPAAPASAPAPPMHEHKPPHHGCLVELGEEFSHLELVLEPTTGTLTGYALDGEAEKAVRLKQAQIIFQLSAVTAEGGKEPLLLQPPANLILQGVANPLSGETVGDTSEFTAQSDLLKGAKRFKATLTAISIRGADFKDVAFEYPVGNDAHAPAPPAPPAPLGPATAPAPKGE